MVFYHKIYYFVPYFVIQYYGILYAIVTYDIVFILICVVYTAREKKCFINGIQPLASTLLVTYFLKTFMYTPLIPLPKI